MDSLNDAITVPYLLDLAAKQHESAVFLHALDECANTKQTITCGQVHKQVIQSALLLRGRGVKKGDRVALLIDMNVPSIVFTLAVISLGAVAVLANRKLPPQILSEMLENCSVTLALRNEDCTLQEISQDSRHGNITDLESVSSSHECLVLFTSGTTSIPKAVVHSHTTILARNNLFVQGRELSLAPIYHVMGILTVLRCIQMNVCMTYFEAPLSPELVAAALKKWKPGYFRIVPSLLEGLIPLCESDPDLVDQMKNLHITVSGAQVRSAIPKFYSKRGITMACLWAQTESGRILLPTIANEDGEYLMKPCPRVTIQLDAIDEDDPNVGELVVLNPKEFLALGYINGGKVCPFSLDDYRTGDIFSRTELGEYRYLMRTNSLIVHANGEKSNPLPFWDVKRTCPLIKHVCVIGNQRPHNVLLIQVTEDEITEFLKQQVWDAISLANSNAPPQSRVRRNQIIFVPASFSEFPLNPKGEVIMRRAETLFSEEIEKIYKNYELKPCILKELSRYPDVTAALYGEIKKEIARIVGLPDDQIDARASLTEMGVYSLLARQIHNSLTSMLAIELPTIFAFEYPSIDLMFAYVKPIVVQKLAENGNNNSTADSEHQRTTVTITEPLHTSTPELVLIQQGTSRYPLFLIHPVGGAVYRYEALAKCMGPKYTVYGIKAHGLRAGDDPPLDDVTVMAANYIQFMRTVQPNGPYHIGGNSFGGIVAFEIVHQLREVGEHTAILALFDVPSRPQTRAQDENQAVISIMLRMFGGEDFVFPQAVQKATLEQKVEFVRTLGRIPPSIDNQEVLRSLAVWIANTKATQKYYQQIIAAPQQYQFLGHLCFFRAVEHSARLPRTTEDEWSAFAETITRMDVPGDHASMMAGPHVTVLAEQLVALLGF